MYLHSHSALLFISILIVFWIYRFIILFSSSFCSFTCYLHIIQAFLLLVRFCIFSVFIVAQLLVIPISVFLSDFSFKLLFFYLFAYSIYFGFVCRSTYFLSILIIPFVHRVHLACISFISISFSLLYFFLSFFRLYHLTQILFSYFL